VQVTKKDGNGPTLVDRQGEKKGVSQVASLSEASTSKGLARAILAVEDTMVREARPVESPMQAAHTMHHEIHLAKALATLTSLSDNKSGGLFGNAYANGEGKGRGQVSGNGNAYGLSDGNGNGNAFGLGTTVAVTVVTPPAVMTDAGNGVGKGNGNGNGYGKLK
jgi:hypothetical protein